MSEKICPICETKYDDLEKQCPNCGYKAPMNMDKTMTRLLCFAIIVTAFYHISKTEIFDFAKQFYKETYQEEVEFYGYDDVFDTKEIYLSPMSELSGLSNAQILDERKRHVRKSIVFSDLENYYPNPSVYKMKDGLPWISAYEIVKNGLESKELSKGISRHSMMINNPELLLGFIIPDYSFKNKDIEPSDVDYFYPKKITWNEKTKTIKAYFDYSGFIQKRGYMRIEFYPDDTNARDLGYDWIHCDEIQNAFFKSSDNISKRIYQLKGYYHRGYSCGIEGGCNNYSPNQPEIVFFVTSRSAVLKFKLWKQKPFSKYQKADINYEMHFE
ncbi:MAG: hypothetical protein IJB79_08495 [Candidatus Gastranaerophilales bacterium]|nr:hypothetical protein [Candidatus Gastranaerophilales bacterium]